MKGAYYALLDWRKRERITEIAKRMTYIELSADNSFYEAFTSALFLPHTDMSKFPSVEAALNVTSRVDCNCKLRTENGGHHVHHWREYSHHL